MGTTEPVLVVPVCDPARTEYLDATIRQATGRVQFESVVQGGRVVPDRIEVGVTRMVSHSTRVAPPDVLDLLDLMCELLGARAVRFHVADYSLRTLQHIGRNGSIGNPQRITGTMIGRVFTSGEVHVQGARPTVVSVPLVDGATRIGVLELDFEEWNGGLPDLLEPIVAIFVSAWIVKARYTDVAARARRSEPLAPAAEVQWDLLPPLTCSTEKVAVSGILEPAYSIGGDSFDYAVDHSCVDFVVVDAIGHGMPAVLMSAAAINSLRNSRRARLDLTAAHAIADAAISAQFGRSYFVTAIIGKLDVLTGMLTWINAGHVLPMLVRNGTYAGPLECAASRPLGLGGPIVEIAQHALQRGDRVLFYTDGITEARSSDGEFFGEERLADFLVRASLAQLPANETVRRLADDIVDFADAGLRDDATMLLMEHDPPPA